MANLIEITKQDGSVLKSTLTQARTPVHLMPGDTIRVVDAATGKTPAGVKVRKIGDNLLVEGLEDGKAVEVSDFYTTKGAQVSLQDAAGSTSTVSTATPVDAGGVVYGADTAVATAAAQAGAGAAAPPAQTGAPAATVPTWAYVAGGAVLIGAAAGGGGGGGGGGSPGTGTGTGGTSTPKTVTTPTVTLADASDTGVKGDGKTSAATPTVTGTADANAKITISYVDGAGTTQTFTTMADASGKWSVALPTALADAAKTTLVVTASDGTTSSAAANLDIVRDTAAPTAPTITLAADSDTGVVGDNATSATKPTLNGTAEAGSTITLTYTDASGAARTETTTTGTDGKWTAALGNALAVGTAAIGVTATDAAGNASGKTTLSLSIQNALSVAPTGAIVADADGITATNGVTTDRTPTLGGTAGGGATGVSVTYVDAAGASHTETATVTNGNWTLTPAFKLALGGATAVQVTSTDGTLTSQPVTVNVTVNPDNAFTASADTVIGGAGAKTIFGGAAGHVRASTFEYWKTDAASSFVGVGNSGNYDYAIFDTGAKLGGWAVATPGGADVDGRVSAAQAVYLRADYPDAPATVAAGDGNHWVFEGSSGDGKGVSMSQTVDLAVGRTYSMAIKLSDPATLGTFLSDPLNANRADEQSIEVRWNGNVVARYDADSGWDTTIPGATFTAEGGGSSRGTLVITGLTGTGGDVDSTAGTVTISTYNPAASATPNIFGVRVDSVTLTPTGTADGDNVLVGGAGNDTITSGTGNDSMWGGNWADTSATARSGESNTFVFSMKHDNGNDVIKDFHVGVDKLVIADVLDTYNTGTATQGGTWAATGAGRDVTRLPGPTTDGTTVANSDYNLSFHDVLVGDSPYQNIVVAGSTGGGTTGDVKLTFVGNGGVALGSVTLEGVAYTNQTVADLMGGGGYNDPTINAGATTPVLYLTGDGFHAQIAQNVV